MYSVNCFFYFTLFYRNDPKYLDKQVLANSVDPDHTTLEEAVWLGSTLFAIQSVSFGQVTACQNHIVQILG